MLKKSLLSIAIAASVVGVSGCDISSTTSNAGNTPESQVKNQVAEQERAGVVSPVFNPVNSQLPIGIDLIFAAASEPGADGTANTDAAGSTSESAVTNAIDDLDGGISTLAPIDIAFNGSLDPDSVVAGTNVHLVRLPNAADVESGELILPTEGDVTTADDINVLDLATLSPLFAQTKPDGTAADDSAFAEGMGLPESVVALNLYGANDGIPFGSPAPAPTQTDGIIATQPQAGTDYEVSILSLDGGTNNTIRISPTKPLDSKTKYIVVITDGITAADGEKIEPSADYAAIRTNDDPSTFVTPSLASVQQAINGWELLASTIITQGSSANAANLGGNIVLSSAFTTGSPTTVLGAMAAPGAALPDALNPGGAVSGAIEPQPRDFEFVPAGQVPVSSFGLTGEVLISQGAIKLPQYVEALATNPNDIWNALDESPVSDVDGSKNVTYNFPFAKEKRDVVVPLLMFAPDPTGSCGAKPADGWPVVIIQHGFTSDRTGNLYNGVAIADELCHAAIAMDLPHHGVSAESGDQLAFTVDPNIAATATTTPWAFAVKSLIENEATDLDATMLDELAERHENLYLDSTTGQTLPMDFDNEVGGSGTLFIRLDNFQRTRDNMRQGVMDLFNLNASLANIDLDGDGNGDIDTTNLGAIKYIGHSLGAILGTPFVALNNASLAGNTNLNAISAAVLATPGGHLTKAIENSVGLSSQFLPALAGVNASLVQGNSALEGYMQVLQNTIDSADPMNFAGALQQVAGEGTQVLLVGMYGGAALGESAYPSDLVVPVTGEGTVLANGDDKAPTAENPLTGLEPLVTLLGAENVTGATTGNVYVAKYNEGDHSTFSSAGNRGIDAEEGIFDSSDAWDEMKAQYVDLFDDLTFTDNRNASVLISD